ncbi:MAG: hypothetical protein JO349_05420 [Candidatus Eremiobacteraeota bacterium]|nr:hypothetical protein [Candidatus Eremiobacteraeota bacterium]
MLLLAALFPAIGRAEPTTEADVLISAGHEGRPQSCALFPQRACNLGAAGERAATPVVADAATRRLRAAGFRVVRVPADYRGHYHVRAAIFIHFDGAEPACTTGASIGYAHGSADAARAWRTFYTRIFPFRFMPDNFTVNLSQYYGYRTVDRNPNTLVIELGEITCPAQREWLLPRERYLGDLIARFIGERLSGGNLRAGG